MDAQRIIQVTVPPNVVFRSFVSETVLLNVETGQYHGLKGAAGKLFEALVEHGSIQAAVPRLADTFDVSRERLTADLEAFVRGLEERGLLEVQRDDGA